MKNQTVGFLIIGIAILLGFIIFVFNRALTDIVNTSCTHGKSCPMWGTIDFQTNVAVGVLIFVIIIGILLIFFGNEEPITEIVTDNEPKKVEVPQVLPRKITKENYQKVMATMNAEENNVLEKIIEAEGTIFQSDIVTKTNFTKVKVTRILDKLEGKGLIERKRRGMTNVVILKQLPESQPN